MKNTYLIPVRVLLVLCLLPGLLIADELDTLVKNSKEIINTYALKLQNEYDDAYNSDDLLFVKKVCAVKAKETAESIANNNWEIRRITLNRINAVNSPDQTEERVMEDFLDKLAAGKKADELAWFQLKEIGNQSEFRYIRAFTLEDRCMACHEVSVNNNGNFPGLALYSVRKVEQKNYLPEKPEQNSSEPLPEFKE